MIFDDDEFEYDPCWDCPWWDYGCSVEGECPETVPIS